MPGNGNLQFVLRPARLGDAAEIARLAGELGYPAAAAEMRARLAALLPLRAHYLAVAEAGDGLLGWAAAEIRSLLVAGRKAELMGLVVAARARRRGIGKTLVADAERWAAAQGCEHLSVRSNVARAESHPFYERLGYARTKTQHVYRKRLDTARPEASGE